MPRRPRITMPDVPLHLIQRGNNRQACFFADDDYLFYLDWLKESADKAECAIHAYALMTNHVHLLLTPKSANSPGRMMKQLGQRYVQYINRTYRRSGTLWEGRFRSCLIQQETYLFSCHRYVELNPVRAGIVSHPAEYRWSSYRHNAQGEHSSLLVHHPLYLTMGSAPRQRQMAYRELFRHHLDTEIVDQLRSATNGNYAVGSSLFQEQVAAALGRRVTRGKDGRPSRQAAVDSLALFDD